VIEPGCDRHAATPSVEDTATLRTSTIATDPTVEPADVAATSGARCRPDDDDAPWLQGARQAAAVNWQRSNGSREAATVFGQTFFEDPFDALATNVH
jgi:hypothetical protein